MLCAQIFGSLRPRQVLSLWLRAVPGYLKRIQEGVRSVSLSRNAAAASKLRGAAHALKGSLKTVHATHAAAAAQLLETIMRAAEQEGGFHDAAALADAWSAVQRDVEMLEATVRQVLGECQ